MASAKLYVGIEAVGMRQTVAAMCDENGAIVAAVRLGEPITLHTTPRDLLESHLEYLVRNLFLQAGIPFSRFKDTPVCIGLTGTTFAHDRTVVLPSLFGRLKSFPTTPICTGDVEITFAGGVQSQSGSAVMCHSGSTAYVVTEDDNASHHVRFGGWGPAIGDDGSGYSIGCSALRAIGLEHDRNTQPSVLWEEVNKWLLNPLSFTAKANEVAAWMEGSEFWRMAVRDVTPTQGIDHRTLLFYFAHKMQPGGIRERPDDNEGLEYWRRIASGLVTPVVSAFRKGDTVAKRILENAASILSDQHFEAYTVAKSRFDAQSPSPVVLYGGVLTHNSDFRLLVRDRIQERFPPEIKFITNTSSRAMRPVCGALLFALGSSRTDVLRLPTRETVEQVIESQASGVWRGVLQND